MKITILLFASLLGISPKLQSQTNSLIVPGTRNIGKNLNMKTTEVTINDWIVFIIDNEFDSTLFPNIDLLSKPSQLLFLDLKKRQDFDYLTISKPKTDFVLGRIKLASSTRKLYEESHEEAKGLTLHLPITGISFTQAKKYCNWLEYRINRNGRIKVKVDLPSEKIYNEVITNKDSLNVKGCALFNFIDCHCISNTKKNYNLYLGKGLTRADHYWPTEAGLYNLQGNAAEMTDIEGRAKGGSFKHYAKESYSNQTQYYSGPMEWLGFRYILSRY